MMRRLRRVMVSAEVSRQARPYSHKKKEWVGQEVEKARAGHELTLTDPNGLTLTYPNLP